jgi:hypothetical protein
VIEKSHGKARPTLPRSSDLRDLPTARERSADRQADGRFAVGNTQARGRGWKASIRKTLGRVEGANDAAEAVADDAWRIFCATVREMPSDGPSVRGLLMQQAKQSALSAFWEGESARRGLTSEGGVEASELAMRHGQRAERLLVTAIDVATKLATKRDDREGMPWLTAKGAT